MKPLFEFWHFFSICLIMLCFNALLTLSHSGVHHPSGVEKRLLPSEDSEFESTTKQEILMPDVQPSKHDQYLCTAKAVDVKAAYIVQLEAKAVNNKAHHILLFGCQSVDDYKLKGYWECDVGILCNNMKILFAWAKNAPPTSLPKDVGFRIGENSDINYLILQVHYALPLNEKDNSGLVLSVTYKPQKYIAGIFLLMAMSTQIPPHKQIVHSDVNCQYKSDIPIHPFAYRVHAHRLGTVITGYKVNSKNGEWTELGKGNPQWPQAFYPMKEVFTVAKNDLLVARCTFNSTSRDTWTVIGSTAADEMCNFYIMYYTNALDGTSFDTCSDVEYRRLTALIPPDSDVQLPPNPLLEEKALGMAMATTSPSNGSKGVVIQPGLALKPAGNKKGHGLGVPLGNGDFDDYHGNANSGSHGRKGAETPSSQQDDSYFYDVSRGRIHHEDSSEKAFSADTTPVADGASTDTENQKEGKFFNWFKSSPAQKESMYNDAPNWPNLQQQLGQVTAVALNSKGNVVLFHRGSTIWGFSSFDLHDRYAGNQNDPISVDTVITLDHNSGEVLDSWGKNLFFMPHGLFLDEHDNIWITDVALHQVMKFPADGSNTPLLTLGKRFEPGSDDNHFCKPTGVAVTKTGEFFVSDGYCNTRIMKYSPKGELILKWGQETGSTLGFKFGAPQPYAFDVPHSLALAEEKGLILVADRENGRIQCFYSSNGTFHSQIIDRDFGGRLFGVGYSPVDGGTVYAVNGPSAGIWSRGVKGFVIKLDTRETVGYFVPSLKALSNPHDIVATSDGNDVYVAEIGPNRVWKFIRADHSSGRLLPGTAHEATQVSLSTSTSRPRQNATSIRPPSAVAPITTSKLNRPLEDSKAVKENLSHSNGLVGNANFTASMIIMALLAIPVLLMILVAVYIRLKKQGKFHSCNVGHVKGWVTGYKTPNQERFGIGNLLNRHKGFDRVRMEDSDAEPEASESDVEEFSASVQKA